MSELSDILQSGIEEVESLLVQTGTGEPEQIVFNLVGGGTYSAPCVPRRIGDGTGLSIGGFEFPVRAIVTCRRDLFTTADNAELTVDSILIYADNASPSPVPDKTVSFRGTTRRILYVVEDGAKSHVIISLGDINR